MNNKCKFLIVLFLIFSVATLPLQAEKYKGTIVKKSPKADALCLKPAAVTELSLNNVRALLKTNGTMWFQERAEYEVPKGSGKTSLFSSSLWVGGYSRRPNEQGYQGSLYLAAMRFGQVGNDYWTGPLKIQGATIDPVSCSYYDKFYEISRIEVERHIAAIKRNDPSYVMPPSIRNWPAHGRDGESTFLAPYHDVAGDPNKYEPELGDYPYYDFANDLCPWTTKNLERAKIKPWLDVPGGEVSDIGLYPNPEALPMPKERELTRMDYGWDNKMIYADHVLKGDQTIFWFLNDKGNAHTETGNINPIGLEIRVQAFAFSTNDELNKMTFYSYEVINRGSTTLYHTYFSQWCDPDLGYAYDDYVGCDVMRGLGYCYNGFEEDLSVEWAYGANPPAVGLDFFQGPYIDPDGADNPHFYKNRADINGSPEEIAYCERFVHQIFNNFSALDTNLMIKFILDHNTGDTIRWNDQFAINGVNFGDGIVDNERFGMRAFTHHDNTQSGVTGDPQMDFQYYNFLSGRWGNGTPFTYGGTGHQSGTNIVCKFVFPKGTDYCNWGTEGVDPGADYLHGGRTGNWSEMEPFGVNTITPNTPYDRRFMQSAGPFTLRQGACNYVTVGVPWARALQGGREAALTLLFVADDKCQALFENCFKILDGPDAPTLTIREYDQKLIMLLTNSPDSNNANEDYEEDDQTISQELSFLDSVDITYRFEGYQIFQVTGPSVSANDLDNPSLARLVQQYDIVNYNKAGFPIGRLINWEYDEILGFAVPFEKVNGSNTGIQHSFEVTQDLFATGTARLVNYKTYYYIAIAYAYNEFFPYTTDPEIANGLYGQKLPYLRGRKTPDGSSVIPIAAVPHPPSLHGGGATLNSDYGSIPYITRIDGQGNGGVALELSQESIDKIMAGGDNNTWRVRELKYEKNAGPLNVKVIDPLRVKPFDFTLAIRDSIMDKDTTISLQNRNDVTNEAYWVLSIDQTVSDQELRDAGLIDFNGKVIREFYSQTFIGQSYEQIIIPLGISLTIFNKDFTPGDPKIEKFHHQILGNNGLRGDTYKMKHFFYKSEKIDIRNDIVFENNGSAWITGLVDDNAPYSFRASNWIRSGSYNLGRWQDDYQNEGARNKFSVYRLEDFHVPSRLVGDWESSNTAEDRTFRDASGKFGTLCGGTWAPYILSSPYGNGPQAKYTEPEDLPPGDNEAPPYHGGQNDFVGGLHNYYSVQSVRSNTNRFGSNIFYYLNQPGFNPTMTNLYSVNIVITPDKNKWTRSIVLEACQDSRYSENGALKHEPRKAKSVDKSGNPDGSTDGFTIDGKPGGDYGMGWFPGYAINIETGERLNIMFAENSDRRFEEFGDLVNGRDMIFNPTSTYAIALNTIDVPLDMYGYQGTLSLFRGQVIEKEYYDFLCYEFSEADVTSWGIRRVWGGMHYVYVCGSSGNTSAAHYLDNSVSGFPPLSPNFLSPARRNFNLRDTVFNLVSTHRWGGQYDGYIDEAKKYAYYDCGPYDASAWLVQKFAQVLSYEVAASSILYRKHTKMQLFNNVMYTHIPLQPDNPDLKQYWMSCDVTYKIRVTRPYLRYISRWYESPELRDNDYVVPDEYQRYQGFPTYQLSTRGLEPTFHDTRSYQSILDNINIVPNPYNAASLYERNKIETMVKITNLPTDLKNNAPITINIFTVNGILVRTLTKGDSETTYVNWDLKNYANIPVASGVYIIHVNCPGIGERMLKFFCTMRQTDLDSF